VSRFVEYDAERGMAMWEDRTQDGRLQVHYRQDVEGVLNYTKALRNDSMTDAGIKRDMWHYAHIPQVVIYEMLYKHGVDIFNKDHTKKVFELINREYPHLKTTSKVHYERH
jgi:hypothetical protein